MPRSSMVLRVALMLVSVPQSNVHAQHGALAPSTNQYAVRGIFEGTELDPWQSQLTIADTVILSMPAYRATHESRRDGNRFLFTATATWRREGSASTVMYWSNGGRAPSTCFLEQHGAQLKGVIAGQPIERALADARDAIPDFALGAYLAMRAFGAGDTVKVSVVRCLPGAITQLEARDVPLIIHSDTATRGGGAPEEAWFIDSAGLYDIKVWIAKSDRTVLRVELPQGQMGHSIETIVRSQK